MLKLIRFYTPKLGIRLGVQASELIYDLSDEINSLDTWFHQSTGYVEGAIQWLQTLVDNQRKGFPFSNFLNSPDETQPHLLPPVESQEVWAAGVTYERSRIARQEEAIDGGDVYARVYSADRPEIFFKAS